MGYLKTTSLCDLLNEPYHRIIELIRARKVPRPSKDASGDYIWSPEDIERVRQALAARRCPKQNAEVPA